MEPPRVTARAGGLWGLGGLPPPVRRRKVLVFAYMASGGAPAAGDPEECPQSPPSPPDSTVLLSGQIRSTQSCQSGKSLSLLRHTRGGRMKSKSRTLTKVKSMPSPKLKNHIRAHRKRSWLSQSEVAMLVGSQTGASVSRHECFRRLPTLPTGLAYEIIFGTPMRDLFPGLFEDVQKATLSRAETLADKLRASPKMNHAVHKLKLLQEILARSKSTNQRSTVA